MPTYSSKFGGRAGKEKKSNVAKERKSKPKCPICHKAGHEGPECPKRPEGGIPPSGIEFRGKKAGGLGGGTAHKGSKKAGRQKDGRNCEKESDRLRLRLPDGFFSEQDVTLSMLSTVRDRDDDDDAPHSLFLDAGSDVNAVLDALAQSNSGKKNSKTPEDEYAKRLLNDAPWNFGGAVIRQLVNVKKGWEETGEKNERVRRALTPRNKVWFSVGIGPGNLVSNEDGDYDDEEESIAALFDVCLLSPNVVSVFSTIDYSGEVTAQRGFDRER